MKVVHLITKSLTKRMVKKCKDHPCIKMTNEAKKKFSCCPEIGWVKFFLSLTRSHKSHTQTEKFSLANLNVRIYVFFISNNKSYFSLKDISEADK